MPNKKQRAKAKKQGKPPQRVAKISHCFACSKTQVVSNMNSHTVTITNNGKRSWRTCAFLCNACNTKDNIRLAKEMLRESNSNHLDGLGFRVFRG